MYANGAAAAHTYLIPEPFERALKLLREALRKEGLSIPMELDLARRVRRELGVTLLPCKVLCVDSPMVLVEAMAIDSAGAIFLPLHVVVAARGPQTLVHMASPATIRQAEVPVGVKAPLGRLQMRLAAILQRLGGRQGLCALSG
jgi:uncharacterized protein (DUF302 family)